MNRKAIVMMIAAMIAAVSSTEWARDGGPDAEHGRGPRRTKDSSAETRPDEEKPRPPRGGWRGGPRLTEEQEEELLAAIKKWMPERHARLAALKESNPGRYAAYLAGVWRWYQGFKQMPEDVQKATIARQNAQVRIGVLLERARETESEGERDRLRQQIAKQVAVMFDAEQVEREYRLSRLEQRIQDLRKELKHRSEQREKIIAQRVQQLLSGEHKPDEKPRNLGMLHP